MDYVSFWAFGNDSNIICICLTITTIAWSQTRKFPVLWISEQRNLWHYSERLDQNQFTEVHSVQNWSYWNYSVPSERNENQMCHRGHQTIYCLLLETQCLFNLNILKHNFAYSSYSSEGWAKKFKDYSYLKGCIVSNFSTMCQESS